MKLYQLLKDVNVTKIEGKDREISKIVHNSAEAEENCLFICVKGGTSDGTEFAARAVKSGAVALVCENQPTIGEESKEGVTIVYTDNARKAMSKIAANFYGRAHEKLKIIGITGTNGKTTICHAVEAILKAAGKNVGIIGTLGIRYNNKFIAPELTTPDPIFLHKIFKDMADNDVKYVVMEVSAHAIALNKTEGLSFEIGAITNCTQDHLDFFKSMKSYSECKKSFLGENCRYGLCCSDDELGMEIIKEERTNVFSVGIDNPSDVFAVDVVHEKDGESFTVNAFDRIFSLKSNLIGKFNISNLLFASAIGIMLNIPEEKICIGLNGLKGVPGRLEKAGEYHGGSVYVDYAHTPDGLLRVLQTLRARTEKRVICLFGCGGNRDREKRKIMGRISGENADFTVITSDNPRFEEPCAIMSEIEKGLREISKEYIAVENRKTAIGYAIKMMEKGDTLLIAGKGAEEYQEIMGVKHNFCDREVVESFISENV